MTQQLIQPGPTPEQWIIDVVPMSDGRQLVAVQILTLSGTHVSFCEGEQAATIGQMLIDHGRRITSGLVLPPGVRVPPRANGHKDHPDA
jgi:hypothetical protein